MTTTTTPTTIPITQCNYCKRKYPLVFLRCPYCKTKNPNKKETPS